MIANWPEMQNVIDRTGARRSRDWRLPLLACEAVGGTVADVIPAAAAFACVQISIIFVDDMLDLDPRGEYRRAGSGPTANMALAFQAAGLEAAAQSDLPELIKTAVLTSLNRMALTVAYGQYLDSLNSANEADYWRVVETKSAPFFGTGLEIGALAGKASMDSVDKLRQLGGLYGEMIQIHDDLSDTLAQPANQDWLLGRSSLPILFAQIVPHPERDRFLTLRQAIADPEALAEAQSILVRCGAVSYCAAQLVERSQKAKNLLAEIPNLTNQDRLAELLENLITPIWRLL